MISAIIVIFIALGGGASFVAESSVPGDPLYIVKTSVNEQIMSMVSTGDEARANWEASLATRRLNEAAELELRGTLTDERATKLNAEFNSHSEAAIAAAKKLTVSNIGSSGQDGVEVSLITKLNAVVTQDHVLFAPRDSASGQATGKKVFVLPHVLEASYEVKAPRDTASGQASGKIVVPAGDGVIHPAPAPTTGAKMDMQATDASVQGSGGAEVKTGSTELQATYDLKAMKK